MCREPGLLEHGFKIIQSRKCLYSIESTTIKCSSRKQLVCDKYNLCEDKWGKCHLDICLLSVPHRTLLHILLNTPTKTNVCCAQGHLTCDFKWSSKPIFTPCSSTTSTSESVAQDITCSELELHSFHRPDQLLLALNVNIYVALNAVYIWLHWLSKREQPTLQKDTADCPHKLKEWQAVYGTYLIVIVFLTNEYHNMHYFLFLFGIC